MDTTATPQAGDLLVAVPEMRDMNFRRSVVLICEHADDGPLGLITKQSFSVTVGVLSLDIDVEGPLSLGGPVDRNMLHYLHRCGDVIHDALHLTGNRFWGGNFDSMRGLVNDYDARTPRLTVLCGVCRLGAKSVGRRNL